MSLSSLADLLKVPIKDTAWKLLNSITKGNYISFCQVVAVLETEMAKLRGIEQPQEEGESDDEEEYYYEEDRKFEHCHLNIEADPAKVVDIRAFIAELCKITDKRGHPIIHLAAMEAVKSGDVRYLQRLIEVGFPMYQEDYRRRHPAFNLADIRDDNLFITCYNIFKKRGFNPLRKCSERKYEVSFLDHFFYVGHVTSAKIRAIFSTRILPYPGLAGIKVEESKSEGKKYKMPYLTEEQTSTLF